MGIKRQNILFVLAATVMASASFAAQAPQCIEIFGPSQIETVLNDYIGVSLTYAPALQFSDRARTFDDSVLVEFYQAQNMFPRKQLLLPYYHTPTYTNQPYGKEIFHKAGLKAIYQNYGPRVSSEIVAVLIKVEDALPLDRQASFLARARGTDDVYGFLRIFDGSLYNGKNDGVRGLSSPYLPMEKILKAMHKSTNTAEEYRKQGKSVYELGKYFIADGMNARDAKVVKSDIFRWLIEFMDSRGAEDIKNSYYLAHVASRTHRLAYQRFFGFKAAPKDKSNNLDADEDVLFISGEDLHKKIQALKNELDKPDLELE